MTYGKEFYDFIIISPTRLLFDTFIRMNRINKSKYYCVIKIEDIEGLNRQLQTIRIGYNNNFNMLDVEKLGYKHPFYFKGEL